MVFSSVFFLFYFLPIVLVFYFITPKKFRNLLLLVSSLFFYSWGEPKYIWIMLFSTLVDFTSGKMIHRHKENNDQKKAKHWLLVSVFVNLGLLGFFKYTDFMIENINSIFSLGIPLLKLTLPIGISFYTFQTMSYTIDLYRGETKVQNSILNFATYVTLFPQLIAGPIVRYQTVANELDSREETPDMISDGIQRFILGLSKKVLLANNIGLLWDQISTGVFGMSVMGAWLGIVCFAFQIYFDFSGYSDMAIGLGKIFGFNFLENFNYPYMSKSITEFWRRWHISLGTWFKEYVYIPLGGNRGSFSVQIRNIILVWLLTGIWHGASWNFLIWGLYFALILIFEKLFFFEKLKKMPAFVSHIYTLFLVLISWVIFAFDSMTMGINYLKMMFGIGNIAFINSDFIYLFSSNFILLLVLIFASTNLPKRLIKNLDKKPQWTQFILENGYLVLLLILSISYLVNSSYNPFLYFRF